MHHENLKQIHFIFCFNPICFNFCSRCSRGEPTTIQGLLQLVEQGRTTEQGVNAKREADFLADKNKQAAKLAAEKRELARQEKIADQLRS
jgi:biopolymer transport protein ExbB